MEDSIILSVYFNIAESLHSEITKASLEIRDIYGANWFIDNRRYYLHLALYLFEAPKRNIEKILREAKKLAKTIDPTPIKIKGMSANQEGLVFIDLEENSELRQYHCQIVENLNPFREGVLREKYKDEEHLKTLPADAREKLQKYGHRWVLDKFHPHITLSKLLDPKRCKEVIKTYENKFVGRTSQTTSLRIHEAIYGPNGRSIILLDEKL